MKKFLITVFCFISHTSFASAGVDFYFDRNPTIAHNVYASSIIHFDHPMDRAVLSWNATTPDNSYIELYLRSRAPHGKWSNWFALGIWGQRIPSHSLKQAETKFGKVDIDTVELKIPATDWQYKVVLHPSATGTIPHVANMALAVKNRQAYSRKINPPIETVKPLSVPVFSQYEAGKNAGNPDLGKRICSPTSDAMLLTFNGVQNLMPMDMAARVYDSVGSEHYGNWPFNTAAIYTALQELQPLPSIVSYVRWYESFNELLAHVKNGMPVIVSIGFKEGELNGASKPTPGHLVVVRGADQKYIYVNDPAAPDNKTVARRYDRTQFIKAWKGVAYVVQK